MTSPHMGEIKFMASDQIKDGEVMVWNGRCWNRIGRNITMSRADIHNYLDECRCDMKQGQSKLTSTGVKSHVIQYAENNLDVIELLNRYGFL